jgi:hypothetical protein
MIHRVSGREHYGGTIGVVARHFREVRHKTSLRDVATPKCNVLKYRRMLDAERTWRRNVSSPFGLPLNQPCTSPLRRVFLHLERSRYRQTLFCSWLSFP